MTKRDNEIINEMWLLLNKSSQKQENTQVVPTKNNKRHAIFSEKNSKFLLSKMEEKNLIQKDDNEEYFVPEKYDYLQYKEAILFGIKSSFLENKISKEEKDKAIKEIFKIEQEEAHVSQQERELKVKEREKVFKSEKIEKLKKQNWLLILNDINKIPSKNEEIVKSLKMEFHQKLKGFFKK